ncbi:uncharacterized protein LOC124368089 [Homalodisca vitripennis]|uniref:uncharacterized protein LOC124368089 n=1 Tax=Homalodisca vitripennis TaxID=197043 RepID=UPI001EEC232E|nr:uncharacterized protein LOC124368089 [Homalodisca vitripennis]
MTILPLAPTHHTAESDTLLDLLVVTDPSDVTHLGQLPIPAVSRHDLVYCVIKVKVPKPKVKIIKYRDFKSMDEASFMYDVYSTPWQNLQTLQSVDDMVEAFNTTILGLYDKHAPVVTKRITKRRPVPWITCEILSLMAQRDSMYRRARRAKNVLQWLRSYLSGRRQCVQVYMRLNCDPARYTAPDANVAVGLPDVL